MAKPTAYFPNTSLPSLQELAEDSDTDNLSVVGSITQRADQVLTAGYASSGAIAVTITGAFSTWPAFGVVENLTTLEQMAYSRANNNTLDIPAGGRARNGTAAAAGSVGHSMRFVEKRILGRWAAQIQQEIEAHDLFLRSGLGVNLVGNSGLEYFQRGGISGAVTMTNAVYNGPDRFFSLIQGTGPTAQRQAAPAGFTAPFVMRLVSGGTANRGAILQALEYRDVKPFRSWPATASVKVKAVKNAGSGSINVRWALLEWTGTVDAPTKSLVNSWASGTYTPGNFFISSTYSVLAIGSAAVAHNTVSKITVDATLGASANNLVMMVWLQDAPAHASDYIEVGDFALNPGRIAPPLWRPRALDELPHLLRFFSKSFNLDTTPAEAVQNRHAGLGAVLTGGTGLYSGEISFPVRMRTAPIIALYRPSVAGSAGQWCYYNTSSTWVGGASTASANEASFYVGITVSLTGQHAYPLLGDWTASAEL